MLQVQPRALVTWRRWPGAPCCKQPWSSTAQEAQHVKIGRVRAVPSDDLSQTVKIQQQLNLTCNCVLLAMRFNPVWCTARFATPPTCAPVSGVNTRRHAFALLEQCLHVRAVMNRVHAHHNVAHCSRVVAMHGLVRAAVNSSKLHKLAVNRSTAAVVTRHERCAVSNHARCDEWSACAS